MLYNEKIKSADEILSAYWSKRAREEHEGFKQWSNQLLANDEIMHLIQQGEAAPTLVLYQLKRMGVYWSWKGQALLPSDVETFLHYYRGIQQKLEEEAK